MPHLMTGLHDIPNPDPLLPGIQVPWWGWLILASLLFTSLWALFFLLSRRRFTSSPDTHFDDSRDALERLRSSVDGLSVAEIATGSSLVLRQYLVLTMREPALYETHEEFLLRSDALDKLPGGARERLAPFLSELASAKYGPSTADPAAGHQLIDQSLAVLQGLESTRERILA